MRVLTMIIHPSQWLTNVVKLDQLLQFQELSKFGTTYDQIGKMNYNYGVDGYTL